MDPDACFSELLELDADNNIIDAHEHATNLREWIDKGGFYPGGGKIRKQSVDAWLNAKLEEYSAKLNQ